MIPFRDAINNDVGGEAEGGPRPLALRPAPRPMQFRAAEAPSLAEQTLYDHVVAYIQSAQPLFPRSLIVQYAQALARSPLVLISGPSTQAAFELSRLFAEAIAGTNSAQIGLISSAAWHRQTGEDGLYRGVHDRFSSLRFQALLHEAHDPANLGKAFFACFDLLTPQALAAQFTTLDALADVFPLAVSAVIAGTDLAAARVLLPQATVIPMATPCFHAAIPMPPSPVGYQRIWLRTMNEQRATFHTTPIDDHTHTWRVAA